MDNKKQLIYKSIKSRYFCGIDIEVCKDLEDAVFPCCLLLR